jgi:hypothetical protein
MASTRTHFKLFEVTPSTICCKDNNKGVCYHFQPHMHEWEFLKPINFITKEENKPNILNELFCFVHTCQIL